MLEVVLHSFLASIPVYLCFAIGFFLRYRKAVTAQDEKAIVHICMDVAYPCLIFFNIMKYAVVEPNANFQSPLFCLQAAGCGFLEMLIGVVVAYGVAKLLRLHLHEGLRTFVVSSGLQNYIFFVIPLLQVLSTGPDDPSMGVLFIHNVGSEIFVWSFAIFLMSGQREHLQLSALFRGPLLAVFVSLALVWTGVADVVAQPFIMRSTELVGMIATPVSLILCGCSIYDVMKNASWEPKMMGAGIIARLFLTPVLILLAAWILPVDPIIKRIMVIQAAIPSAVVSVLLARRFGGKPELAMQIILATTIFAILTLPIWLLLGDQYITPIFAAQ